jgi:hypothetical protein
MVWPVKTHPAQSTGPEGKKNSGDGENFSLDFSFYRTSTTTAYIASHPAADLRYRGDALRLMENFMAWANAKYRLALVGSVADALFVFGVVAEF